MTLPVTPIGRHMWVKGDYRYGASIRSTGASIDALAQAAGAAPQEFHEDGLGPGKALGLRLPNGRQVAFEQYDGGSREVSLLVLFENGTCSASEIREVLDLFGIPELAVTWIAPEAK